MIKNGLVIKHTGSWYKVQTGDGKNYNSKITGKLRLQGVKSTNPIAVGDKVAIEIPNDDNAAVIKEIHDRKNYIIRKSTNLSRQSHIIAANLDQVFLVATIKMPVTTTIFIDRFLATAEAYQIPVIIIFNKTDIYAEKEIRKLNRLIHIYEDIGYPCIASSAEQNININVIKQKMAGKVSLFTGHSGTGKSTILNMIEPGLKLKTSEISEYHKSGKHTTTFYEMFPLSDGGYVIDSPGIKGFGVHEFAKNELWHFFPEIFKAGEQCQFHNCTHTHEPKCYVKELVEKSEIAESRYLSYLNIYFDEDEKYRTGF